VVERAAGESDFYPLQSLSRTAQTFIDWRAAPEITYRYRLRIINDVGEIGTDPVETSWDASNSGGQGMPEGWQGWLNISTNGWQTIDRSISLDVYRPR
jgi:hypothetical protein